MVKNTIIPFPLIFNVICVNKLIIAAPSDYCHSLLNTSDCLMAPTPVFTYYKPGSRCDIELWRGCDTLNKFENEYECAHACIGRLNPTFSAEIDNAIVSSESRKRECEKSINLNDCGRLEEVFTYNDTIGKCLQIEWKGCETYNKFDDLSSCTKTCKRFTQESDMYKDKSGSGSSDEEIDKDSSSEDEKTDISNKEKKKGKAQLKNVNAAEEKSDSDSTDSKNSTVSKESSNDRNKEKSNEKNALKLHQRKGSNKDSESLEEYGPPTITTVLRI